MYSIEPPAERPTARMILTKVGFEFSNCYKLGSGRYSKVYKGWFFIFFILISLIFNTSRICRSLQGCESSFCNQSHRPGEDFGRVQTKVPASWDGRMANTRSCRFVGIFWSSFKCTTKFQDMFFSTKISRSTATILVGFYFVPVNHNTICFSHFSNHGIGNWGHGEFGFQQCFSI